ncbi:MAG: hypothetical protein IJU37_00805 [Desulfovibrio sp.]|nr:hypothetical protein [Desulfovibrio sp.]
MAYVLVINHHSMYAEGFVAENAAVGAQLLNTFFETWRMAVERDLAERFIICDTDIYTWNVCPGVTFHNYFQKLSPTNMRFVAQLLKISQKTSLAHFSDSILEIMQNAKAYLPDMGVDLDLIGCVSLADGSFLLSLATNTVWSASTVRIDWQTQDKKKINALPPECPNIATPAQVEMRADELEQLHPYTKDRLRSKIPGTVITDRFWQWFDELNRTVQECFVKKAQFCASQGWHARKQSPYAPLQGTHNNLTELRVWPVGKTLRIYIKQESPNRLILLGGSDKDGQDIAVQAADKYYDAYSAEM